MVINNVTETGCISKTVKSQSDSRLLGAVSQRKMVGMNHLCHMSYVFCLHIALPLMFILTTVSMYLQYDSVSCCSRAPEGNKQATTGCSVL